MTIKQTLFFCGAFFLLTPMAWGDANLTYLNGSNYEVGDPNRQILTFEHSSRADWGDTFFFMDYIVPDEGDDDTYFEFQPRLSMSHLSGRKLSNAWVKDVYLAGQMEGSPDFKNYLAGVGFSLNVPGFRYLNVNLYQVNNELKDNDQQATISWAYPFSIGSAEFIYDGFIDAATTQDSHAAETLVNSQLKWDIGKWLFNTKKPVYLGFEHSWWNNKFGLDHIKENNASFLLKAHF